MSAAANVTVVATAATIAQPRRASRRYGLGFGRVRLR
jgi:hypothetical protein